MPSQTVDITTDEGVADAFLARPGDNARHPAVIFYMDGFGLRQRLYDMAERIATEGYVVLVPNVFYRHGRAPLIADLPDLLKPENRERMLEAIRPLGAGLTVQASMRDADAYLDFLAGYESVARGPVGITGYCMGGALAVRTAGTFPDRVAAAASFHGGNLATEAPDSPHLLADRIQAELYFGHADQDRSMPADQIARLEEALDRAGVRYQSEVYEGAAHGYTMSDTAAYSPAAIDRHWTALFALLGRTFQATR
jgi:carboxymethylenebutenolidase